MTTLKLAMERVIQAAEQVPVSTDLQNAIDSLGEIIQNQLPCRQLISKPVASGAGIGFCPCGWKSKVADDGGEYGWNDIRMDFDAHTCNPPRPA